MSSSFLTITGKTIFCSALEKKKKNILSHAPISMYNVNPERQGGGGGGGGGGGVREEVKMLVHFFRVGTKDKFNKCS